MAYTLIRIIMAIIFISGAFMWGDWKNWKKYYPTMLFFGMGNLIYCIIYHNIPLWRFTTDIIAASITELFVIFTVFFSTALIYLSNFPKKFLHRIIYMILWIGLYIGIELFTASIGMIKYFNGWNLWWSLLYDIFLFSILIIHHKKPVIAWSITIVIGALLMIKFNVPFLT